ncbi:hypothetical protein CKAN_00283100 [Cinnamomum micranthum f. kanehirae]|uniref:Secreted protein n=1 Tax=Cinnamomum micranthum f. kanehirae TaxID=337451 RepID=A0A3S3N846_9MAGN|nr:hypothetical protein CKAN_00283100 [Cinnamomum micranthum f. kanehirae]
MADWAPVIIGVVLFVLLSPGLLFQLPGHSRPVEFGSMKTNGKAVVRWVEQDDSNLCVSEETPLRLERRSRNSNAAPGGCTLPMSSGATVQNEDTWNCPSRFFMIDALHCIVLSGKRSLERLRRQLSPA